MKKRGLVLALTWALVLAFGGCGDDKNDNKNDDKNDDKKEETQDGKKDGNKDSDKKDGDKKDGDKDDDKDDDDKNDEKESACDKAIPLVLNISANYCDKPGIQESCRQLCQDIASQLGISEHTPEGKVDCQGRELNVAETCLKNEALCKKCMDLALKAQCEGRPFLPWEAIECSPLSDILTP